jgi:hypothetical protein
LLEEVQDKAFELKKILVLSGIFFSRSMRDINPDLPDHIVDKSNVPKEQIDGDAYDTMVRSYEYAFLHGEAHEKLAAMIHARVEMANLKVPATVAFAKKSWQNKAIKF